MGRGTSVGGKKAVREDTNKRGREGERVGNLGRKGMSVVGGRRR